MLVFMLNINEKILNLWKSTGASTPENLKAVEQACIDCLEGNYQYKDKDTLLSSLKVIDMYIDRKTKVNSFTGNDRLDKAYEVLTKSDPDLFYNKALPKLVALREEIWNGALNGQT